jgi:hypothetical protein
LKGYSQMTPAERSVFIATKIAECDHNLAQLHAEMADAFRAEGVPEHEIAAKVEAYFAQDDSVMAAESSNSFISY